MNTRRNFLAMSLKASALVGGATFFSGNLFTALSATTATKTFNIASTQTLSNGVQIPILGFGTYSIKGDKGINTITEALKIGYRHIDTAAIYDTEKEVGAAITKSGVKREEVFITTKLPNDVGTQQDTLKSFHQSLENLKTDYVDLYLIHWPEPEPFKNNWLQRDIEVWQTMEKLYKEKRIRAIGISNFYQKHLKEFLPKCEIKPMVNQIEIHPFYLEEDLIALCRQNNIAIEAYSPLARGDNALNNAVLQKMAKKYKKSVPQIMLRWSIQMGFIPLPRTSNLSRLKENSDIFNFTISSVDMKAITALKSANDKRIPV